MSENQLQSKSSCNGVVDNILGFPEPDLLNWEETKWEMSNNTRIKEYTDYPCISKQIDTLTVLMPYAASSFDDAISRCTVLGGKMGPPKSEQDMKTSHAKVRNNVKNYDCSAYLWLACKYKLTPN